MKSFIRKYFGFSETETNGFIILIPLIFLLLFIPLIYKKTLLYYDDDSIVNESDRKLLKAWLSEIDSTISIEKKTILKPESFHFNPNTVSLEELKRLGFSKTIIQRIEKYRSVGGNFKSKESLLNIYGISKIRVKALLDYIDIPKNKKSNTKNLNKYDNTKTEYKKRKKYNHIIYNFELNTVPADSLLKIRGIGQFFSKNIIAYRNRLGGFNNLVQLNEVFGMKKAIIDTIAKHTIITSSLITKININTDSFKILVKHPYISYNLTSAILSYKKQHGNYQKIEDLKGIKILSDSIYLNLEPYLKIGE